MLGDLEDEKNGPPKQGFCARPPLFTIGLKDETNSNLRTRIIENVHRDHRTS